MAAVSDHLVEIPSKDLPTLKNMYKSKDGERTQIAYEAIDVLMRILEQDPSANTFIKFYCLNGDISDGTFIVMVSNKLKHFHIGGGFSSNFAMFFFQKRLRAHADTLNKSLDNLQRLLQLVDYSNGYVFLSVHSEHRQVFKDAFEKINVKIGYEYTSLLYHLARDKAVNFITE